jgi:hypothetical protein
MKKETVGRAGASKVEALAPNDTERKKLRKQHR